MNSLYPLKFAPIFKNKIWGGDKIKTLLGKDFAPLPNCGESWELSGVEGDISVIQNGFLAGNDLEELLEVYMGDLVGDKVYEKFGLQFPILVKIIDSRDWLSIQVHPDDQLAIKRHKQNGKSEMWYVLQADEGAELIRGFNKEMTEQEYLQHFQNKTLPEILKYEKVKAGDVFYIPAGTIHALGPGVFLAEIQQTSDITYRIYDWNRVNIAGIPRELHTDLALAAIDFNQHEQSEHAGKHMSNQRCNLVKSEHFTTNILMIDKPYSADYFLLDSFVIYLCTEGSFTIHYADGKLKVCKGEIILIPAELNELQLIPGPNATLLEVFIEQ